MLYVMNYADSAFENVRKQNTVSAYKYGKTEIVLEYGPNDIDEGYKLEHRSIFSYKRGAGLWLWKPYLIIKALETLTEEDWLFYCDAGAVFINSLIPLVNFAEQNGKDVLFFELPLLAKEFTKKETLLKCGDDGNHNQILASYMLLRKSDRVFALLKEWQTLCEDESLLSPKVFNTNIKENPLFGGHREDQSLLDIVVRRHGLEVFRDPSDYGEFPFHYQHDPNWTYCAKKYPDCNYPTILLGVRNLDLMKYKKNYRRFHFMSALGLYNATIFFAKRRFMIWLYSESFIHTIYKKLFKQSC